MKFSCILVLFFSLTVFAQESKSFKNESELGIVLAGGNNDLSTVSLKQSNSINKDSSVVSLSARYLRSTSEGLEQAFQWGAGLKYEYLLSSKLGVFAGQLVESNIYQNILQRHATDLGGKYHFYRAEKDFVWFLEGGYRYTRENYPSGFALIHFMRLNTELERYFAENLSTKIGAEFLPNLTRSSAFQLNANASLMAAVSGIVSLKTGLEFRYNQEPPAGARSRSDRIFTTALVAKF